MLKQKISVNAGLEKRTHFVGAKLFLSLLVCLPPLPKAT